MTKEELYDLYVIQELSTRQVGKILGLTGRTVLYHLKKHGIPTRTKSEALSGNKNPMYGKSHSDAVKQQISANCQQTFNQPEERAKRSKRVRGKKNPMYGNTHSKKARQNISASMSKRMTDPSERQKVSDAVKMLWQDKCYRNNFIEHAKTWTGENNSFHGKKHTDETCEKISKANKGRFLGEKGPNWRGGVTPLRHKIRNCEQYKKWRKAVFERDHYICQMCNNGSNKLRADHIKPFAIILIENEIDSFEDAMECNALWDITNGRTMCDPCHKKTDTYGWNSYWLKVYSTLQQESQSSDLS